MRTIEDQAFLWLLVATSLAFGLIAWPYFGAILWGVVAAIVFAPLYRSLLRITGKRAGILAACSSPLHSYNTPPQRRAIKIPTWVIIR